MLCLFLIPTETLHHLVQSFHRVNSRIQSLEREVKILAILALERHQTQGAVDKFRIGVAHLLDDVPQGEKIAGTFRHFLVIDEEVAAVHPIIRESFPGERLRLRDLVLMMRKEVVDAAHVDVNLLAEVAIITRAAFDVPAGTSLDMFFFTINHEFDFPKIRSIALLVVRFPERKIGDLVFFIFVIVDAHTRDHAAHVEVCEFAIIGEFFY